MRATISEFEQNHTALWEGEIISASWDGDSGEFKILGDPDSEAFRAVLSSITEKHKMTIGIEDPEATKLIWSGYIGSAIFQTSGTEQVECNLVMSLDDWFGIPPS